MDAGARTQAEASDPQTKAESDVIMGGASDLQKEAESDVIVGEASAPQKAVEEVSALQKEAELDVIVGGAPEPDGTVKEASTSVCPDVEITQNLGVELSPEEGKNTKKKKIKRSANDPRDKPVTHPNNVNILRKQELEEEGPEEGQNPSKKKKRSANDLRGQPVTPMKDASTKNTKKEAKTNGTGPSVKKASEKGGISSKTDQEAKTNQEAEANQEVCMAISVFTLS